jgi:hypothetical protein
MRNTLAVDPFGAACPKFSFFVQRF